MTTDSDDEHVCALAVAGGADLLESFDHGYMRKERRERGVVVLDPETTSPRCLPRNRTWYSPP